MLEQWNMGWWPPKLSGSRFIKEKCWISDRFVMGGRIVEYGPVAAKAAWGQIHKGKASDF